MESMFEKYKFYKIKMKQKVKNKKMTLKAKKVEELM